MASSMSRSTPASPATAATTPKANAWQYSWYVPQDVAGLIGAMGGDAKFVAKLDQLFDAKVDPAQFKDVEDITGLIGWYAHGNEPSHHIAYLYDYAGAPWKTQQRLKQIMDSQYARGRTACRQRRPRPDVGVVRLHRAGLLPGDAGQRRVCDRATVRAEGGDPSSQRPYLQRGGRSLDDAHPYVGAVTLNGKPLDRVYLHHAEILAGGELHFTMQADAEQALGAGRLRRGRRRRVAMAN
jgi:putative alpha-1,2-mannosidase